MAHDTVQGKLFYVARYAGFTVVFQSYWISGTYGLGADALFALNRAGAAATLSDWDLITIDGPFRTRWSAKKHAKSALSASSEESSAVDDGSDGAPAAQGESNEIAASTSIERPGFIDVDYAQPDESAAVFETVALYEDASETPDDSSEYDTASEVADNADEAENHVSIETLKRRLVRKWSENQNGAPGV